MLSNAVPSDVVSDVTLFGPAAPVAPVSPVSPLGIVKLNTAALVVPLFVTLAFVPAEPVVVVPTVTVAAVPVAPVAPVAPVTPVGMPKLNTAALEVPAFVTVADAPGESVVVVPTAIVAAAPGSPFGPTFKRMIVGLPALPSSTKSGPEKARISTVEILMV
jgi:hypothetical protein